MAIAAIIRMIAITISSSIRLKPRESLLLSFPVRCWADLYFSSNCMTLSPDQSALLQRQAADCRSTAVRDVTDDAALIAEEGALAALSHVHRMSHNRVGLESVHPPLARVAVAPI